MIFFLLPFSSLLVKRADNCGLAFFIKGYIMDYENNYEISSLDGYTFITEDTVKNGKYAMAWSVDNRNANFTRTNGAYKIICHCRKPNESKQNRPSRIFQYI